MSRHYAAMTVFFLHFVTLLGGLPPEIPTKPRFERSRSPQPVSYAERRRFGKPDYD